MPRPALSVKVSKSDQAALKKILAAGVEQVRVTLRAVALQRLGEGMSAPRIAAVLPLTRQSVRNLARRYQQGGLERALHDKQRPGAASLLSAKRRQRIIAMVCSDPPPGRARQDRDRGRPHGSPLPHHRTYGSVPRRFGRVKRSKRLTHEANRASRNRHWAAPAGRPHAATSPTSQSGIRQLWLLSCGARPIAVS